MTTVELKQYHTIIIDCWQLFKKYSTPIADKSFWEALIKDADIIYCKHGQISFIAKILMEIINEIENIFKTERDKPKPKQVTMFQN